MVQVGVTRFLRARGVMGRRPRALLGLLLVQCLLWRARAGPAAVCLDQESTLEDVVSCYMGKAAPRPEGSVGRGARGC